MTKGANVYWVRQLSLNFLPGCRSLLSRFAPLNVFYRKMSLFLPAAFIMTSWRWKHGRQTQQNNTWCKFDFYISRGRLEAASAFCLICFCPVINFLPQTPACVWSEHAGELMRVMRQCFLHYTAADVPFTPQRWQLKRWHKCQSSNFLTLLKIWPAEFPHLFFDCSPAASLSGWPGDFSPHCGSQTSMEELPGGGALSLTVTRAPKSPKQTWGVFVWGAARGSLATLPLRTSDSCPCLLNLQSVSVRTQNMIIPVEGSFCVPSIRFISIAPCYNKGVSWYFPYQERALIAASSEKIYWSDKKKHLEQTTSRKIYLPLIKHFH